MKKFILFLSVFTLCVTGALAQSDLTPESQLNVSSSRNASGNERNNSTISENSKVPQDLLNRYNQAVDSRSEQQKITYAKEVERILSPNEHEIRLVATPEIPGSSMSVKFITDAPSGTLYERPAITIQQRHESQPQRILVTCTKNDRAVYHYSTDGGAAWNIDFGLGLASQTVDFTSCSSDSLYAGGKDFIAAYINLNGDSVTVRHGELGFLGVPQYKRNNNPGSGQMAPVCAIYKEGISKYSAFAYAGFGPAGIYYNMEYLLNGIENINGNIPKGYSLSQNYPNPFNPTTNIEFAVPNRTRVKLVIYDILGKSVEVLANNEFAAGTYKIDWNAANHPSGVYFYRLETGSFTEVKKMILVK